MKFKLTILLVLFIANSFSQQVREVVIAEYCNTIITDDGAAYVSVWINGTGLKLVPYAGDHRFVEGRGGLYPVLLRKATGELYIGDPKKTNLRPFLFDTLGIPFKAISIDCYMQSFYAVRADGTIWFAGTNSPKYFSTDQNRVLGKWAKIPGQPAIKFKAVAKGTQLVALAEDGSVYTLSDGSASWVKKSLPGPAEKVYATDNGFYLAIINGQPWGWGQTRYLIGATGITTNPIALAAVWGIEGHSIIDLAVNRNTIHFILDDNRLFGMGDNAQGEVGNGYELVNKVEYKGKRYVYGWESPTQSNYQQVAFVSKPEHILPGTLFKKVWGGGTYAFYKFAQDINGGVYSWGRNKAAVLYHTQKDKPGIGLAVSNESELPNWGDVPIPTKVDPLNVVTPAPGKFIPGTVSAGKDTAIEGSAFTLAGSAVASRSSNFTYKIAAMEWTQLSGPACNILNPASANADVNFKSAGQHVFKLMVTDDQGGTMADTVVVNVTIPNKPPTVEAYCSKVVIDNSIILAAKATDPDGQIKATEWDKLTGPADHMIDIVKDVVLITFSSGGQYTYRFSAFDDKGASTTVDVTLIVYQTGTDSYIIMKK